MQGRNLKVNAGPEPDVRQKPNAVNAGPELEAGPEPDAGPKPNAVNAGPEPDVGPKPYAVNACSIRKCKRCKSKGQCWGTAQGAARR
ncbi:hypothetical protein CRG98_021368 [Punica granatum]|uniref:Uncharacterized protein n=1 Tax=Punica granatum TaxID=22663 RepID=A0A2I0JS26_PUNGR|nr:hypothetical protein CRG98_021368 [Punica granatum]